MDFAKDKILPEDLLLGIPEAIHLRQPSITIAWNLVWDNDKVYCVPTKQTKPEQIFLMRINDKDCREGLTLVQWNRLNSKIAKIKYGIKKCQPLFKP